MTDASPFNYTIKFEMNALSKENAELLKKAVQDEYPHFECEIIDEELAFDLLVKDLRQWLERRNISLTASTDAMLTVIAGYVGNAPNREEFDRHLDMICNRLRNIELKFCGSRYEPT